MRAFLYRAPIIAAACFVAGNASADNVPPPDSLSAYADPAGVVLAVRALAAGPGEAVRLAVYDGEETFLRQPAIKHGGHFDADGIAAIPLYGLEPGAYAFVVYHDVNGDGRLNRDALGRPTEPFAFSNGARPKLRKPRFDEARVEVAPGDVILIALD